jgi:hypothetical protein
MKRRNPKVPAPNEPINPSAMPGDVLRSEAKQRSKRSDYLIVMPMVVLAEPEPIPARLRKRR